VVSLASRVIATVMVGVLWFAVIVLCLAFVPGLNLWQKAAVFLASAAIVGGIIAAFWIRYGLKLSSATSEK